MEIVLLLLLVAVAGLLLTVLFLLRRLPDRLKQERQGDNERLLEQQRLSAAAITAGFHTLQESQNGAIAQLAGETGRILEVYRRTMELGQDRAVQGLQQLQESQAAKLDKLSQSMDARLAAMQADNQKKLEEMRVTVDEKLQRTLDERIGQSFQLVSQRLEQVYKGLGEMQALAVGVGDLKKVLANVKTRGVLGEYQLGAILEQILAPEQYAANVSTKPGSRETVEYALRLPGNGEGTIWLPIDAKFPADAYEALMEAYDSGDSHQVAAAVQVLEQRIRRFARDIRDKYVAPPYTTDFALLFLPFEGLYAEVVRRGLVESLQRDYKINIAGPTTLAALLNSLQMGFRTLAIQKRSSEVWQVLGAVKTEFEKFGQALEVTQQRLDQAYRELDALVGVRSRQIRRRLKDVDALPEQESAALLYQEAEDEGKRSFLEPVRAEEPQ